MFIKEKFYKNIFINFTLANLSSLLLNFSVTSDTNLIVIFTIPIFFLYYKFLINKDQLFFILILIFFSITSGTYYFAWMNVYSKMLYPLATFVFLIFFSLSFIGDYLINKYITNKIIFKSKKNYKQKLIPFFPFIWIILIYLLDITTIGAFLYTFTYFFPLSSPFIKIFKVYGITFIILIFSQIIAYNLVFKNKKLIFISIFLYILFISFSIFYSLYYKDLLYNNFSKNYSDNKKIIKLRFALIQGNFRESWEIRKNNVKLILLTYINLTKEAFIKERFDIAIWPEYAIPGDIINDESLKNEISNLAKELNIYILTGCSPWIYNDPPYQNYNTAVLFDNNGKIIKSYYSVNPLPFDYDVKPGKSYEIFEIKGLKFAVQMCYEEVFDRITKIFINKYKVDFIVVLTNHALFDNLKGAYQTTLLSRIHASTYGKYILRATNSGYTMVISPTGKIKSKIPKQKRDYLVDEISIIKDNSIINY